MKQKADQKRLALYFLALIATALSIGVAVRFSNGEYKLALYIFAILLVVACLAFFIAKQPKEIDDPNDLLNALVANRNAVESGTYIYRGHKISKETLLVQYMFAASFIAFSHKTPTRYYVSGVENTTFVLIVCSLASGILGWWGLPFGPIFTIQALATNFSGGIKTRVSDVL